jgi:hypothetical protein
MHLYQFYLLQQWVACTVIFLLLGNQAVVIRVFEWITAISLLPPSYTTSSLGDARNLRLF